MSSLLTLFSTPWLLSLTITGTNESSKVGDTLTATVKGAAAAKYEWTLNGTVVGATEKYTVPASAVTGDVIIVTVTDEEGNTASDTAIVSGLTIVKVEPTTASGVVGGTDVGYKYVRIFFSEPLSSLDASEVEIRHTKTKQLYSIETVKLSNTGLFADVILYGSFDGDGTTFLQANEPYVATVTHDGLTDSLEFELPANAADKVVVAVDVKNNKIVTAASNRSNETQAASDIGTFDLGLSYGGNLGELLGRTVNYSYNADNIISDFTVQDEVVVIDTVKLYRGSDNGTLADDYFKGSDGTKYYLEEDDKSTKNKTVMISAKDIDETNNTPTAATALADGTTYGFAKMILNPNGTVARAVVQTTTPTFLKVQSMSGTTAVADKATSMNFDGYVIIDAATSDLLAAEDLNVNDNVFYSIADKFAYVYNESVSGELSDVVKGKLEIDGVEYNWSGSKYFDDASGKYVELKTDSEANSTAGQDYLNSLDPDDVEVQLWMSGDIAFVFGDVVGETTTTTTTYIVTQTASMAAVGFDNLIKLPVNDGTTSSTLTIDPTKLKSYGGKAGKVTDTTVGTFDFDYSSDAETDETITPAGVFTINTLVDVVTDEDGTVIGLKSYGKDRVTATSNPDATDAASKGTVAKDIATVTTGKGTFKMNPSTDVWIFVKNTAGTKADSVKKVKFSDYALETKDLKNNTVLNVYADTSNAAVKSLIIVQEDKDVDAFQKGDTAKVKGFVTAVKYVRNSDGSASDVLKSVTITLSDKSSVTYEGDGSCADAIATGGVYELTYYKSNDQVKAAAVVDGSATGKIHAAKDYSNSTLTLTTGFKVIPDKDCLILKHYVVGGDEDKFDPITVEEITSASNGWDITYWAVSTETGKSSVANFIVVEDDGSTLAAKKAAEAAKIATLADPYPLTATASSATKQTFNVNSITGVGGDIFLLGATATATSSDFVAGEVTIDGSKSTLLTTGAGAGEKATITITTKMGNKLKVELTTDATLVATSLKAQTSTTVGAASDLAPGAATNSKTFVGTAGDILDQYGDALSGTEGTGATVTNVTVTKTNADTGTYTYGVAVTVTGGVPTFTVTATGGTTEGNLTAGDTISFTVLGSNVTYTVGASAAAGTYSVTAA